jgi:hypothetical protein
VCNLTLEKVCTLSQKSDSAPELTSSPELDQNLGRDVPNFTDS